MPMYLQAGQDCAVQMHWEWPFQSWFVLSLGKEGLQMDELDLQV